jgi:anti-sigma regulatory factor (Ser/Thr protein kinase)
VPAGGVATVAGRAHSEAAPGAARCSDRHQAVPGPTYHPANERPGAMSSDLPDHWTPQPPPDSSTATRTWNWAITRPAQLTSARSQLRADLSPDRLPAGADLDDVDRLLLAFEELASNGLRHGGPPVDVHVAEFPSGWLIDVTDARLDCSPVPAVGRDPALGGLGLHLIARLSARFGWAVVGARKHVWACLRPTG